MADSDTLNLNLSGDPLGDPLFTLNEPPPIPGVTDYMKVLEESKESLEEVDRLIAAPKQKLKYPNNTEGYGASITFTLMETKTFADVKGQENSSFSTMSKTFAEAKSAAADARSANKAAKLQEKIAKNMETATNPLDALRGPLAGSAANKKNEINAKKEQAKILRQQSDDLSEKAVALSRQGTSQLAAAITEAGGNAERTTTKREDVPTIQLYLPISFQQTDGFQIAGTDLGILGASVFAGTANTGSIIKGVGEGISSGFGSIIDLANNNVNGLNAATVVSRLATKFAPTEVANAFNIAAGVTVNPNTRSTFRGVNLREYTFQFKFLPKTQREAEDVEEMIKLFRTYAYPEAIEMGGVAAGYKFPDLFKIDIRVQMGEGRDTIVGNKLKHCYLRSISTNYNPTSMTFHTDGRPVEIDLSLSFQEETTLSRKDIEEGY